jgi:hypothetical protein
MKKLLSIALLVLIVQATRAQVPEVTWEGTTKIIKGFMSKRDLATDTAFAWFASNQQGYVPDQKALQAFRSQKDSINIIAFGGTWCGDTKNVLPKFFMLADASGLSPDRITLLGVDRSKKTIQHLTEIFNVTHVPTIIVMKNGKELGRVVEYGKYGMFDKELGEIVGGK